MANRAIIAVAKQVAKLREEEAQEDSWFVLPDEGDDSTNWTNFTVEIEGPENYTVNPVKDEQGNRPSPFKGGLFRINLKIGENYPMEAPEVAFQTRVWHPQVSPDNGKPCVDLLKEQWNPKLGIRDVLVMLRQMLGNPTTEGGVNSEACGQLTRSVAEFEKVAADYTRKYAMEA